MKYLLIFVSGLLQMLELIASVVSPISHCVRALSQICIACIACVNRNRNMSESLRHLCDHPCILCVPCVHCITYLPLYVFHCAKIDSVQTQWTQGKKHIVEARFTSAQLLSLAPTMRFLPCVGCVSTESILAQ